MTEYEEWLETSNKLVAAGASIGIEVRCFHAGTATWLHELAGDNPQKTQFSDLAPPSPCGEPG